MSNEVKRNYKGSDAEMLTAIAAIMQADIDMSLPIVLSKGRKYSSY